MFKIVDVHDLDAERYEFQYKTLGDALEAYNKFVDRGMAKRERIVALIDKDGEVIMRKEFTE